MILFLLGVIAAFNGRYCIHNAHDFIFFYFSNSFAHADRYFMLNQSTKCIIYKSLPFLIAKLRYGSIP